MTSGRLIATLHRRGSCINLYAHSNPMCCTSRGALRTRPASTSRVPPTPMHTGTPKRSRCEAIHSSCRGKPNATNNTSGRAWRIASIATESSLKYPSTTPTTWSPGYRFRRTSAAAAATPGAAPSRKTRRFSAAASAQTSWASSTPGTRGKAGLPRIRAASTTPIPSAIAREALLSACRIRSSRAARTSIAPLAVTIWCTPPAWSMRRTACTACAMVA